MKRKSLKWFLLVVAGATATAAAAVVLTLTASLPRRSGSLALPGLDAPVSIELDARAVPRIRAASLLDAFRAQGFVHAQERFFQMDLTRRSAAGELAALVGEALLRSDRAQRVFQLRRRAQAIASQLPAEQRTWLEAYASGVNAGLGDLGSRPPEYWLLRAEPEPWTVDDSMLVMLAFYTMLSNNEAYERGQGVMRAALADSVYEFLTPSTSRFDRPIVVSDARDPTAGYRPAAIPPAADVDIGAPAPPGRTQPIVDPPLTGAASNQWAVGPARSSHGGAMLANDPHLGIDLPNVFHRSELYWDGRAARGLGIPGVPGIVIGATEQLAWGVTVSYADQSDWVVVEVDPTDPSRYRVPGGSEAFGREVERIHVAGRSEPELLELSLTRWGPVAQRDWAGRPLALHATWLQPGGAGIDLLSLVLADDVAEGIATLTGWEGPSLNWMLADSTGGTAWTANGPLPDRVGFDGSVPESWADGQRRWRGLLPPPTVIRSAGVGSADGGSADTRSADAGSADATMFTANNRTLPAEAAARLGRMWMRPLRAKRIADLFADGRRYDEADFLAMQLDTRAEGYDLVRDVALETLRPDESDAALAAVRDSIVRWNGTSDAAQSGFRMLHVFYRALLERVLSPLLTPAVAADPEFVYRWPLADEPLRRLLEERPPHLLPRGFSTWTEFLRAVLVDAVRTLEDATDRPDPAAAWGDVNRLDAGHPLASLPLLGNRLRLPPVPQPGSTVSLRVATNGRGAVIRLVVAPTRPEAGVLQMAGGQSGHFLSPHFLDQQRDWVEGVPAPFMAGATEAEFVLEPAADPIRK